MKVKTEKSVSWSEARHILESKSKDAELGYEQKKALEHLNKFSKLTKKDLKEVTKSLAEIDKLNEKHITAVLSFLPRKVEEVNLLFANEHIILSDSDKKTITDLVNSYFKE